GDDAVKHAKRMERARRDRVLRKIGRAETEDIRVDDRLGAEPGSERVAEHSSDAGARAAVWLDGRRVVVRLDLEGEPPRVIERDHSGVVAKDGEAEVAVGTKNQGLRRARDRVAKQVLESDDLSIGTLVLDGRRQRLVAAVLAPGLRDRLELDVERVPSKAREVVADGAHLDHG